MTTATKKTAATKKPKVEKTKANPRGVRKAGGEDMTPVPTAGEGGAAAAEALDRDGAPPPPRDRRYPKYEYIWKAHNVGPERAEAIRVMRERLTRMFEGMDDFITCGVYLNGEEGAEFRLRVSGDHGLRILLDADPDC